jgi:mono/diheme cytochrome c family protein
VLRRNDTAGCNSSGPRTCVRLSVSFGVLALFACSPALLFAATPAQSKAEASAAFERGAAVFAKYGCARCHGKEGMGGGHGPNLRDVGDHLNPEKIRKQIENGGEHMPAYSTILKSGQVDDVVQYLSAHREPTHTAASPAK